MFALKFVAFYQLSPDHFPLFAVFSTIILHYSTVSLGCATILIPPIASTLPMHGFLNVFTCFVGLQAGKKPPWFIGAIILAQITEKGRRRCREHKCLVKVQISTVQDFPTPFKVPISQTEAIMEQQRVSVRK